MIVVYGLRRAPGIPRRSRLAYLGMPGKTERPCPNCEVTYKCRQCSISLIGNHHAGSPALGRSGRRARSGAAQLPAGHSRLMIKSNTRPIEHLHVISTFHRIKPDGETEQAIVRIRGPRRPPCAIVAGGA